MAPAETTWSFEPSSLRWPPRGDMQELPLQVDWEFAQYVLAASLIGSQWMKMEEIEV